MIKINGWQNMSMLDWQGRLSAIVFLPGCNYKCPSCHSAGLVYGKTDAIPEKDFLDYLRKPNTRRWLNGVVISGGEPLVQDIREFVREIKGIKLLDANWQEKKESYGVKLFTNGRDSIRLGQLQGLIDAVSMDIKGLPYKEMTGLKEEDRFDLRDDVEKGILAAQIIPEHEFRTTLVPRYDGKWRWLKEEEIEEMASWANGFTPNEKWEWIIQPFHAKPRGVMLDDRFTIENLPPEMHKTPEYELRKAREIIAKYGFKAK